MTYFDLIELIEQQSEVIKKQAMVIVQLLNQTAEQENLINELIE